MSQADPTDLLCSSRREELTADEQRRLRESLLFSLEVRLMSGILPELERESRVRPGDDVLLARINARALRVLGAHAAHVKPRVKRRTLMLLVAAAVLLVAGLASALLGGARQRPTPPPASTTLKPAAEPKPKPAPRTMAPIAPVQISEPSPATPSASPPRARDSKETALGSASELFAEANLLRRQGRAGDAAVKYELLLDLYPQAREVGPARLALAKYLQNRQPERALTQFRALASSGGALRAEALWGLSEVAAALDRRSVSEQALSDLRREFPDSPYANVAKP